MSNDDIDVAELPFLDKLHTKEVVTMYQDNKGYIWIGTTDGLARYDGYEVLNIRSDYKNPGLLYSNHIKNITETSEYLCIGTTKGLNMIRKDDFSVYVSPFPELVGQEIKSIFYDNEANLWVSVSDKIFKCSPEKREIEKILTDNNTTPTAVSINQFSDRSIWVCGWGDGVYKYCIETNKLISFPKIGKENNSFRIFEDNNGNYWICTWGDGLFRFFPERDMKYEFQRFKGQNELSEYDIFFGIEQDNRSGRLWLLGYNSLRVVEPIDENNVEIKKISSLENINKMYSMIMKDYLGNLWLGAYDAGINILFRDENINYHDFEELRKKSGSDLNINCLNIDDDDIIWFNQERLGLRFYSEKDGKVFLSGKSVIKNLEVDKIIKADDRNSMWVYSSFIPVIFKGKREGEILEITDTLDLRNYNHNQVIDDMVLDELNNLWILSDKKIFVKPFTKKDIIQLTHDIDVSSINVHNEEIIITSKNSLMFLSYKDSLKIFKLDIPEIKLYNDEFLNKISGNQNGIIYCSSSLGNIFRIDVTNKMVENLTSVLNVSGSKILQLHNNDSLLVVLFKEKVLVKSEENNNYKIYKCGDISLPISFFKEKTFMVKGDEIFAAGHKGMIRIGIPDIFNDVTLFKSPRISDIKIDGKSVFFTVDAEGNKYNEGSVEINNNNDNIEIYFSDFSFNNMPNSYLRYKLDGVDKEWRECRENQNSAFYNDPGKGKYLFRVRSIDITDPDIYYEESVMIIRNPAWFESNLAFIIYVIFVLAFIGLFVRFMILRDRQKIYLKIQEELTKTKIEYFTNVSHELLTPLAIMSSVSDNLSAEEYPDKGLLVTLRENITRLNNLIQQVLDFRKSDKGILMLKVSYVDISDILEKLVVNNFVSQAKEKNISFEIDLEKHILGYLDKEKLEMIIFNLMSNALKYSFEYGKIYISLSSIIYNDSKSIEIKIKDQGKGIGKENIERIFTRFYVNEKGTSAYSNGIGLSITKEMIELHKGSIYVNSVKGEGSEFIVTIPIERDCYYEICDVNEEGTLSNIGSASEVQKPTILIIDDNITLLDLIAKSLSKDYNTLCCQRGEDSFSLISSQNVDIILCDIMMPEIDGIELCKKLKSDIESNHIPVIMITAQKNEEAQLESYRAGADGFITKPFDIEVLKARIENLMNSFRLRNERFKMITEPDIKELEYKVTEHSFINKLIECIELHLTDSDFDLGYIASELNVSKSTMNRKIKAITGMTPMDFVRNIRLKFACKLLKSGDKNISEIAYSVGFSNPKYFSTCFKEEFGLTPSEFIKPVETGINHNL